MNHNFVGKVALVTGAGGGMGLATAKAFARAGAAVALVDIKAEAVEREAEMLNREGGKAIAILCDISDEQQVMAMVKRTVDAFGSLDAAYNNAGVNSSKTNTSDLDAEEFDRIMGINLRGVWLCMKYELQQMCRQGSGAIVNCSSNAGLQGVSGRAAYCAAKHGVIGLTKSAALEYAAKGILINAVCPGTIDTPMVRGMVESGDLSIERCAQNAPIGRLGRDDEIAAAVLWLCSPAASYVVGQALSVDGGVTV